MTEQDSGKVPAPFEWLETPRRMFKKRTDQTERILAEELGLGYVDYRQKWVRASRREWLPPFPLYLQIEHSGRCNLRCVGCVQGIERVRKAYVPSSPSLSLDVYGRIIEEARSQGCPSISFHSNDEPFLLPDMEERLRMAKEAGFIDIIVTTNATLLTPSRANALLASGVTKLNFSVDAYREEEYTKIRIGGKFDVVLNNMTYFLETKKRLGRRLPITRVTCVLNKFSAPVMQEFEAFWAPRVDVVEFQNFQAIRGHTENLRPPASHLDTSFSCNSPWQQLVIRASGDVLPCCSFYGTDLVLGQVPQESLQSIWNSPRMKAMREPMLKDDYSFCSSCQDCSTTNYCL